MGSHNLLGALFNFFKTTTGQGGTGGCYWCHAITLQLESLSFYVVYTGILCYGASPVALFPACQCRNHNEAWVLSLGQEDLWRRAWQPTPVVLPGELHGQRSLAGYGP